METEQEAEQTVIDIQNVEEAEDTSMDDVSITSDSTETLSNDAFETTTSTAPEEEHKTAEPTPASTYYHIGHQHPQWLKDELAQRNLRIEEYMKMGGEAMATPNETYNKCVSLLNDLIKDHRTSHSM